MKAIDCAQVDEHDVVALYLAGDLPAADAEAFEAHYFGCATCWEAVRRAGRIRAAMGKPVVETAGAPITPSQRGAEALSLLAAAAAVMVVMLGIRQLAGRTEVTPSEPVYRDSATAVISVDSARAPNGGVRISWAPIDEAQTYVVRVIASDGTPVLKREVGETSLTLDAALFPPPRPGISFLVRVEAIDPLGRLVARSELTALSEG